MWSFKNINKIISVPTLKLSNGFLLHVNKIQIISIIYKTLNPCSYFVLSLPSSPGSTIVEPGFSVSWTHQIISHLWVFASASFVPEMLFPQIAAAQIPTLHSVISSNASLSKGSPGKWPPCFEYPNHSLHILLFSFYSKIISFFTCFSSDSCLKKANSVTRRILSAMVTATSITLGTKYRAVNSLETQATIIHNPHHITCNKWQNNTDCISSLYVWIYPE